MKIKVKPEGREGIYVPDRESLKAWIVAKELTEIHNFMAGRGIFIGADHEQESVLADIDRCERLAILTGDMRRHNMNHALAVVIGNQLQMFDIGEITEDDLEIAKGAQ